MATSSHPRSRRPARVHAIHKPHGTIHPRAQAAGPEHFGVVSIDCAEARSKWMLADFYGRVLLPPAHVEHTRQGLMGLVQSIRQAMTRSGLKDLIVAIEQTGAYHLPVQRACIRAELDTRLVHPFTSKQFRQPADPGNKTDDTDLSAIHRAAVNGFGLINPPAEATFARIQLLARHRRDLVEKMTALRRQIHEHLNMIMPRYAKGFDDIFDSHSPLLIAGESGSAAAIARAGMAGPAERVRRAGLRPHRPTLEEILARAGDAAPAADESAIHHQIMRDLDDDRTAKLRAVEAVEGELAGLLARTPYVLLPSIPGINVPSAGELAGEMGPIRHYRSPRSIAGRAGLYPARHQSDEVDHRDGPLIRPANRRLRRALMVIADNLIEHNDHSRLLRARWGLEGKDPGEIRVRVAGRFSRIAFQLVAGGATYRHPSCRQRDYIPKKLMMFSIEHQHDMRRILCDLEAAVAQLPGAARREEGEALAVELDGLQKKRGSGVQSLGKALPAVLARLGVKLIESTGSGEADLT